MGVAADTYYKFYHYEPSLIAACIFAVLFGFSTVWHVDLIAKHRTWCFIPVVIGGTCMPDLFLFELRDPFSTFNI